VKQQRITGWKGLDLRVNREIADEKTLLVASNVDLKRGGGLKSRDQLRPLFQLDSTSRGLYVVAGKLHAAYPYQESVAFPVPPSNVVYDFLGDETGQMVGGLNRVTAVASWDNQSYLCILRTKSPGSLEYSNYEHHFIPGTQYAKSMAADLSPLTGYKLLLNEPLPLTPADWVGATVQIVNDPLSNGAYVIQSVTQNLSLEWEVTTTTPIPNNTNRTVHVVFYRKHTTLVNTGFLPGPALILAAEKIFASDIASGQVFFSSTEFGPTDWAAVDDAGRLPTQNNVGGDYRVTGLAVFAGDLVVMFRDACQIWKIDPNPANMALKFNIGGSGTVQPDTLANVQGDLVYFGGGAFRTISAVVTTGQAKSSADIGAPIAPITALLTPEEATMSAIWSARRQQYLCVSGNTIYAFTAYEDQNGWTTYDLPDTFEVEAFAELNGVLYLRDRITSMVYAFDASYEDEPNFVWEVQTQYLNGGAKGFLKDWKFFQQVAVGPVTVSFSTNPEVGGDVFDGFTIPKGTTNDIGRVPVMVMSDSLQVRFTGTTQFELESFSFFVEQGALS
jgi:hypothetical protein